MIVAAGAQPLERRASVDGAPAGTGEACGGAPQGDVFIAWDDLFPSTAWAVGLHHRSRHGLVLVTRIRGSVSNPANDELGEELLAGLDYDGDGANDLFLGDLAGDGGNGSVSGIRARDLQRRRAGRHGRRTSTISIDSPPPGRAPHHDPRPRADRHRRRHRGPRRLRRRRPGGPRVLQPVRRAAEPRTEPDRCT